MYKNIFSTFSFIFMKNIIEIQYMKLSKKIRNNICQEHSTDSLNNLVKELNDVYKSSDNIFPVYIENYYHPSILHTCKIIFGGKKKNIEKYIPELQNKGFIHTTNSDTPMSYSFRKDPGNTQWLIFERKLNPRIHTTLVIRLHLDKIDECKDILINIAQTIE